MNRANRHRRGLLLVPLVGAALVACGGGDSEQEVTSTDAATSIVDADPAPADDDAGVQPDPTAIEACLEGAGLIVLSQDELETPYTAEQLDVFELETALLVEGGDTEMISGTINFYRTMEKADTQEVAFEESVTDYTVGRSGTIVYTLFGSTEGGELDMVAATIDGCIAQD
jgi:hypothetical protein